MTKYTLEFSVETKSDPRDVVDFIQRRIKDALPVLSMRYHLIEDRETSVEHHGGVTNEDELTNYRVNADGTKTDLSRGFIP